MAEENIKNLPPEERIKRLKELEDKKKKEIEEAQKMLKETEKELTENEEWKRKVPIPQVASENDSGLSAAEKEIFKAHKWLKEAKEEIEEESPQKKKVSDRKGKSKEEEISLEETVFREKVTLPSELMETEYVIKKSQEPIEAISQRIKNVYDTTKENGYISSETARQVIEDLAATGRKIEDIEAGRYSLTERVAESASLSKSIALGTSILGNYKRRREGQENLYHS